MNWRLLWNSLLVAGLTTVGAVALGGLAALWVAGLGAAWRQRVQALAVLALALPPFLVTNCWLDLLGLTGAWRRWLPLNLYSPAGAAWVLTLLTWPIPLLAALGAWRRLQPCQLESEPRLRGGALVRWLLWPMARGAVAQAAAVVFVLALNNFTVPVILQVKVYPAEVWLRFSTRFDTVGALRLSWPLLLGPALVLLALRRAEIAWPRAENEAAGRALRRQLGAAWGGLAGAAGLLVFGLAVALPLAELLCCEQTWVELPRVWAAAPGAVGYSALFAAGPACVGLAAGPGLRRWRLGAVLWLAFLAPGVLLGVGMIWVFNRPGLERIFGGVAGVMLALTVRYLAVARAGAAHALGSLDRDLVEAARVEGACGWRLWRLVHVPLAGPALAATWYVIYLLGLWDVETLILLVPPGGETLALRIFNLLHYGHHGQVNALCVALLGLALAPLALAGLIRGVWRGWRRLAPELAGSGGESSAAAVGPSRLERTLDV